MSVNNKDQSIDRIKKNPQNKDLQCNNSCPSEFHKQQISKNDTQTQND